MGDNTTGEQNKQYLIRFDEDGFGPEHEQLTAKEVEDELATMGTAFVGEWRRVPYADPDGSLAKGLVDEYVITAAVTIASQVAATLITSFIVTTFGRRDRPKSVVLQSEDQATVIDFDDIAEGTIGRRIRIWIEEHAVPGKPIVYRKIDSDE